jgi:beta-lactamase class A
LPFAQETRTIVLQMKPVTDTKLTNSKPLINNIILVFGGILLFISGFFIARFTGKDSKKPLSDQSHSDTMEYKRNSSDDVGNQNLNRLINPLLDCDGNFGEIGASFSDGLRSEVNRLATIPGVRSISVYFRQLQEGRWVGINEREVFIPASLLKVPLMIAAYRQIEINPSITKNKYTLDANVPAPYPNRIPGSKALIKGQSYTLEELIEYMIVYSDNNAATMIKDAVEPNILTHVFQDLGLKSVEEVQGIYGITARDYGTFMRILYNATYLSQSNSAKALDVLTRVEYKKALMAGLPENIVVAHKFGERESEAGKQLHDCGIVYSDKRIGDYLVCVMVKGGDDYGVMESVISQISKYVYQEADKHIITPE